MQQQQPGVSVVIPAYNGARTLGDTLKTVRAQTWKNLEIIVVDDGSTDATPDIIAAHAAEDPRVVGLTIPNDGVAAARNAGIAIARHDLIAPVDADDLWHPRKIELQMRAWERSGRRAGLVYCWYVMIDEDDMVLEHQDRIDHSGDVLRKICFGNFIGNGSSPLMLKSAVLAAGGFDSSLHARQAQGCEDLQLYFAIAERHDFAVAPHFLLGYRTTRDNMSSDGQRMLRSYDLVMDAAKCRYPAYSREIEAGRIFFVDWMLKRAIIHGTFQQIRPLLREAIRPSLKRLPHIGLLMLKGLRRRIIGIPRNIRFDELPEILA